MTEKYITQVSDEIEGRVTMKLSHELSRTESSILGALSKQCLLNALVWICFVAVPATSRNNDSENREPTGHRSLIDPYSEVEFSACCTSNLTYSDPAETSQSQAATTLKLLNFPNILACRCQNESLNRRTTENEIILRKENKPIRNL